jgi:hypothetical protein
MDNNSGPRDGFIDVFNQGLNWGKSGFDTRHVAVVNFVWEMPWFRDADNAFAKHVLGGWQLSGVTSADRHAVHHRPRRRLPRASAPPTASPGT